MTLNGHAANRHSITSLARASSLAEVAKPTSH